jgi:hypothetical protein
MNELARIFSLFLGSFPARSLINKYFSGQGRAYAVRFGFTNPRSFLKYLPCEIFGCEKLSYMLTFLPVHEDKRRVSRYLPYCGLCDPR